MNVERKTHDRQKVVRGSSVPILTLHAGLNRLFNYYRGYQNHHSHNSRIKLHVQDYIDDRFPK